MADIDTNLQLIDGTGPWVAGPTLPAPAPTLDRVLDTACRRTPEAEALVHLGPAGRTAWTYAELQAEVERRAGGLAAAGVGAGDRVGVVATRQPALVPTVLALVRAGATYVPLDPGAPDARWELLAAEAGLTAVVGPDEHLRGRPTASTRAHLAWDDLPAGTPPPRPGEPDLPAYVLFTSGSTGTPKGVVVSHANVLARIASYLVLTDGPVRYLLHSSLCFDGAVGGMYSTLARGGCLVLPPDDVAADPGRAADVVAAEAVTHLEPVPSWYAALLDLAPPGTLDSVRAVILGGEVLPPALASRHHAVLPDARLFNDYGPTETTVAATVFEVPADWTGERVPIGRPHANTAVAVLDDDGAPAAVGEVGELWVGGPCVALGYLGRPDDPAFATDPDGGRRYATGDLAVWRDDDVLELRGRRDRQVKVRGQRVEPGEVEAALAGLAGVGAAAVEVDRTTGVDRLVAYVAPAEGAELRREDVVEALAGRLPGHLRPDVVVVLAALPLTPGGKVDRRALPAPPAAGAVGGPPRTPVEVAVATAFAETLDLPAVGRGTDFFAVGGDSLTAARVAARLRRELGVAVTIADLGDAPDVARLAARLAERPPADDDRPRRRARPSGTWTVPATPRQESFWFLEHLPGAEGGSNLVEVVSFPPATDPAVLARAVAALGDRHAALRTALVMDDGGLTQVVVPPGEVLHELVDLGVAGDRAVADEMAAKFGGSPFDLDRAPLVRWGLLSHDGRPEVVLAVHHAVADGWSLSVLVDELVATVAAGGSTSELPPLPLEYADLAEDLAERLRTPAADVATEHWRARLTATTTDTELLPYDRPSVQGAGLEAGLVTAAVGPDVVAALRALARQTGATLYHALVASFGAVLHQSSGVDRFLLGGPLSGRGDPDLDRLVGCCINTGLFVVDATGDPSFATLVGRVAKAAAEDEPHRWLPSEVPFRAVDGAVQHHAATVLVNLLNGPVPDLRMPGGTVRHRSLPCAVAYTDLDLYLTPDGEGLRLEAVHGRARLDAETVERLVARWTRLLGTAARHPERPLSALVTLAPGEAAARSALEGDAGRAPAGHLLDLVDRSLAAGDTPALVDATGSRSWSWLAARVDALAAGLTATGVEQGDRVVLAVDGTVDAVALLPACWQVGAVAVPVGARQAPERLAAIASAAGSTTIIGPDDVDALVAAGATGPAPVAARSADDPAYVLFTSGSTGTPKGVVVSHRALLASTLARIDRYADRPPVALLAHDLAFDASLGIITWYLATGGTLVVAGHDERLDPERLGQLIEDHGVGQLDIVPSHYRLLLEEVEATRLRSLALVTLGGEACHPSLVAAHLTAVPWAQLVNEYGPTESTVWATAHECTAADIERARVPIGRPIKGVTARVAAPDGQPRPLGAAGELLLGGHLLADGYLGDPVTTAERFVVLDGERWYRTGDLARLTNDGVLEFLGRLDEQLKVRGHRIEPGEVESVLTELDDVHRAVVGAAGDSLVAWVEVAPGTGLTPAALRAHCRERLPEWLVPSLVTLLDELPETRAGKVDRSRLPAPSTSALADLAPPATELEAAIAELWADLLGHPVGVDQDFFAIGGHSLLAARMVARLRRQLGIEVSLRDLVAMPRIRDLAASAHPAKTDRSAPVREDGALHLTPNQARLWYLQQLEPASCAYHETVVLRLEGALEPTALATALGGLAERHEWLRSAIEATDDGPRQVVHPPSGVTLERAVLGSDDVDAWAAELESRPFDLGAGPLWRAGLAELDDGSAVLAVVLHHVACDATSIGTLLGELGERYDAIVTGTQPDFDDLPSPAAIAAELRRRNDDGQLDVLAAARAAALAGIDVGARLPADVEPTGAPAGRVVVELPTELAAAVHHCAQSSGVPPFAVVASAVGAVVARACGQTDIALGVPIDLRWSLDGADDVVAFLVETAAVPVRSPGARPLAETARGVRDALADALDVPVPFESVVARLRDRGELPRTGAPLHTYAGWLEGEDAPSLGRHGPRVVHLDRPGTAAKFDLHWTAVGRGRGITLHLEHDADRISAAAARRLVDQVVHLLASAAARPGAPLAELDLLTPADREVLTAAEGRLAPTAAADLLDTVAGSVEDVGTGIRLDAVELRRRVDDLAAVLCAEGVRPGDRVGVSASRGAGMVVALLAVLRAGAAFVPLEPRHPLARQRTVVTEAGIDLVVGDSAWIARLGTRGVAVDGGGRAEVEAPPPVWPVRHRDDVAYVMFTSGSTGVPKGVVVTDANVMARVQSYATVLGTDPVRYLLHSALGFDASIYLFWVLANGGTLVVPTDEAAGDPAALADAIASHGVTDSFFVPSLYELVLAAAPGELPSLRQVCVGGEPFPPALVDQHRATAPAARLWNVYGPTETVVTATAHLVTGEPGRSVPIGRPHPGTVARVLGPDGRPVPPGAPGELHLGGPAVSAGYLDRPEETAARFRTDDDGVRWYATGDLVRWDTDGELHFLGRADRQVKLRGQRIELAEIETALRSLPDVRDAAADVVGSGSDARLFALVVADRHDESTARTALAEVLPRGWLPDRLLLVDAVPRLVGGKVDRAALAALATDVEPAPALPSTGSAPTTTERAVAAAMEHLLGRPVGLDDDFFDRGGHSLLAARLVAGLEAQLGVRVTLAELVDGATPRRLAALADRLLASAWAAPSATPTLTLLRPGTDRRPLVVVARDGETGLFLRHFLRQLDPARPLWVLLRPTAAFDSGIAPDLAAEGRAAAAELARAFPDEPIHLVGHSASGLVALETARALGRRAGRTILLDTHPPGRWTDTVGHYARAAVGLLRSPGEKLHWWRYKRRRRQAAAAGVADLDPLLVRELRDDLDLRAVQSFRTRPYRGDVVLVTSASTRERCGADDLGWRRWCPTVEAVALGGDHLGLVMQPLVDDTVATLEQALADAP